jgi:hypothetical protein
MRSAFLVPLLGENPSLRQRAWALSCFRFNTIAAIFFEISIDGSSERRSEEAVFRVDTVATGIKRNRS